MKKIINLVFIFTFFVFATFGKAYGLNLTINEAKDLGRENSEKIRLQKNIVSNIKEKAYEQKYNKYENLYDEVYDFDKKIKVYNNGYPTYDFKEIYKDQVQIEKNYILENEEETLNIFLEGITLKYELSNEEFNLKNEEDILKQYEAKYKNGLITSLDLEKERLKVENLKNKISNLAKKYNLAMDKLTYQLNLNKNEKINLVLSEPDFKSILPEELLDKTKKNKKIFIDLNKDLKDLNEDYEDFKKVYYGYEYIKTKELVEDKIKYKEEDIEQLKKDYLHNYKGTYLTILMKVNSLYREKIENMKLNIQKSKIENYYKVGDVKKSDLNQINFQIDKNIINQYTIVEEIKKLIINYENNSI